ncbi:damage-inducible protein CinA [Pokkaliibacter plantistimulans]|uniref:Damage-inducible protein CinA n=1 Tax=Pokkaliibacter plantistimulans TaxID=1635171 RepID=A0ABX5M316_9GAMM|nr:CinA family protein [Pokkaliibacter plantistimulans]PXF32896.1 damage-inducible protein CinA [Pokkaliibacter plantistimulans]
MSGSQYLPTELLVEQLALRLLAQGAFVATAESCTGGGIAQAMTELPGSSRWFGFGWVTYANAAKEQLLAVPSAVLEHEGAVSEQTVLAMVKGAQVRSGARYAVAVSGVAGPDGGSDEKPVGTVWIAWADGEQHWAEVYMFPGDRRQVRQQTVEFALRGLVEHLDGA